MSKFVPEIPKEFVYENLDLTKLVVPVDCQKPETTEEMINRILNTRLKSVNSDIEEEDNPLDFTLDDDDTGDFPDDFYDNDLEEDLPASSSGQEDHKEPAAPTDEGREEPTLPGLEDLPQSPT